MEATKNGFLGNRLQIAQPKRGHRSGTDAVLLASSLTPRPRDKVLELGSGAGVATLCLAWRCPKTQITGVELDAKLVSLATQNAESNGYAERVSFICQDITTPFSRWSLPAGGFAHIFANPPFYRKGTTLTPPEKSQAHTADPTTLPLWIKRACSLVKARGYVTLIYHAQALDEVITAMSPRLGGLEIKPILPQAGKPATRVLVRGRRDVQTPLRLLPPLILHEADGKPTPTLKGIAREGKALSWL